jgi:hypothetical protein
MKLEQWKTEKLVDYARNPRKNDHGVDRLAAAIKEFGFRVPIVAKSDGLVVDGHMRLKAAKKLGMETVPVLLADDMTDAQIKAFRLSVNKMAELADWDVDLLRIEIDELQGINFDFGAVGFDEAEIVNLMLDKEHGEVDREAEWEGMPEFDDPGPCHRKVIVSFDAPEDVRDFFNLIGQKDTGKTKSIWFPCKERNDLEGMRWAEDG